MNLSTCTFAIKFNPRRHQPALFYAKRFCFLLKVLEDGGQKTLHQVLPPLRNQGYMGVECSVQLANTLNSNGDFVTAMKVIHVKLYAKDTCMLAVNRCS